MVKKAEEIAVALQPVNVLAASPFPGLTYAGEHDDLQEQPMEITMNEKWGGYLNGRVLGRFSELYTGRLTHVRFVPDVENGMVIMVPTADEKAYGAVPVVYSATENGAEVNLRLAVKRLKVVPQAGRIHQFPVTTRTGADGKEYLAFVTKDASTKPAKKRSKSDPAAQKASAAAVAPTVAPVAAVATAPAAVPAQGAAPAPAEQQKQG